MFAQRDGQRNNVQDLLDLMDLKIPDEVAAATSSGSLPCQSSRRKGVAQPFRVLPPVAEQAFLDDGLHRPALAPCNSEK